MNALLSALIDLIIPPRGSERVVRAMSLREFQALDTEDGLPYRDPRVTALVWELKYHRSRPAAALAGALMAERLVAVAAEELGVPLLIPVPMHPARRRERGHNQTELLCEAALKNLAQQKEPRRGLRSATARGLSESSAEDSRTPEGLLFAEHRSLRGTALEKVLGSPPSGRPDFSSSSSAPAMAELQYAPHALARIKQTPTQQGLERGKRLKNVKGSMAARADIVRGRACIVVDDVATTGATLEEARRALKRAGARSVACLALAITN